jgi:hypothetical protein
MVVVRTGHLLPFQLGRLARLGSCGRVPSGEPPAAVATSVAGSFPPTGGRVLNDSTLAELLISGGNSPYSPVESTLTQWGGKVGGKARRCH